MSDSDGEDAMAYFLPNGIADDSPPKRSALMSSFGSIGATRFGGIYGNGAPQPTAFNLSAPLYGGGGLGGGPPTSATGGAVTASGSASTTPSSLPHANFLLSDLGGEILQPRANHEDAMASSNAIGGVLRNPFAFSGAFASLSAAESDARSRLVASSSGVGGGAGGGLYEPSRNDVVGTPKRGNATSSGFRSDAEIFAPSSASALASAPSSGVYGRPTLNANAPAFMASSSNQDPTPYGSSSPSAWPTMNVKPRRAPPGLSKPTETPTSSSMGGNTIVGSGEGPSLSLPPGLPHPTHSTGAFGGYASSSSASSSLFSGEGVRQFASKLRPNFPSISDTFRSGGPPSSDHDFTSTLSELNAKSMSVEEIQSNLKATALAAAHDVVSEAPVDQKPTRLTTPRKATKSPRRGVEFKSPSTGDEKREQSARASVDPRSRMPTRRHEAAALTTSSAAIYGVASPVAGIGNRASGDHRGRNARDPTVSEGAGRNSRATPSEPSSKSGRRSRGGQGASGEPRGGNRNAQTEGVSVPLPVPTTSRKKPPSSVSSVGSDDQLLTVSTMAVAAGESHEMPVKVKESPRDAKPTGRSASAKKSVTPVQSQEKRGGTKRQVYREKAALPDVPKSDVVVKTTKTDVPIVQDGSDADASGTDSQTDGNVEDNVKATPPKAEVPTSKAKTAAVVPSPKAVVEARPSPPKASPAPETPPPMAEADSSNSSDDTKQELEISSESAVEVPITSSSTIDDETASVPESPRATASDVPPSTPSRLESDSGSEIPELSSRAVRASDRKTSAKEHKKDKHKKERSDKKKATAPAKFNKKEKRDSSSSGKGDLADDEPFSSTPTKKESVSAMVKIAALVRDGRVLAKRSIVAIWSACWFLCTEFADRINLKGFLGWSFSYLESFLAVVFSVLLLLSLHGASFFIRLHRVAFRAVLTHRHVGFCFAFLYAFPFLVQYVFPWAPPWAPVCLWYAFLVQLFCTSGPAAMVATFRIVLPLMFLVEGISHHSFLLDLNGAELLLASFILSAMKTSNLCSPIFLMSLAVQCLSAVFLGSELVVQWFQMTLALYSLHAMAATDEDWAGLGDEEEDLSCRPLSMHHSIADYNYHPAPSAPSIQKTKRLDRRALAYVRGRKLR